MEVEMKDRGGRGLPDWQIDSETHDDRLTDGMTVAELLSAKQANASQLIRIHFIWLINHITYRIANRK